MKRIQIVVLAMVMAVSLASVANACVGTPRVDRREGRQQFRIGQGVGSGQLTRGETRRLERGERRIHRMEVRNRRDGQVTADERVRLNHALNYESRRIYRLKHNDITR